MKDLKKNVIFHLVSDNIIDSKIQRSNWYLEFYSDIIYDKLFESKLSFLPEDNF